MTRIAISSLLLIIVLAGCKERESVARLPEGLATGPRTVRTARVQAGLSRDEVRATGTAAALATTKVMPLVPGLIKRLPRKEGDVVKRGQVLAVVDQRQYRLTLRQAQAALEATSVALDATTREKRRFEQLLKEDATARAQYDQVLDKYRGAQAQMKQARVALDMAKKALGDTVLTAPYTGVVVKKVASIGDYATSMPPTVILVLQDVSSLDLKIALPEPELTRVEKGAAVEVHFPSIERKVNAKIARVIRSVNPLTRSFEAVVEIPNPKLELRPGLYARVKIEVKKPRKRLIIPDEAVMDEGSDVFAVYELVDGRARRREVRVAAGDQGRTEIVSGVTDGALLILDPIGLVDGDPVRERPSSRTSGAEKTARPQASRAETAQ